MGGRQRYAKASMITDWIFTISQPSAHSYSGDLERMYIQRMKRSKEREVRLKKKEMRKGKNKNKKMEEKEKKRDGT